MACENLATKADIEKVISELKNCCNNLQKSIAGVSAQIQHVIRAVNESIEIDNRNTKLLYDTLRACCDRQDIIINHTVNYNYFTEQITNIFNQLLFGSCKSPVR